MRKIIFLFTLAISTAIFLFAEDTLQSPDSIRNYKNTIRINVSNPALFGAKNFVLGYERVINESQTISVNAGTLTLPKFELLNYDSISLDKEYTDKGFSIAFDYRFYLQKENKYKAPRGIYLAPYYSFHYFNRLNTWSIESDNSYNEVKTDTRIIMNFVGAQLGYQFIIKERFSIDMVLMGPGIWFYNINTAFATSLSEEDETRVLEILFDALESRFPGGEYLVDQNKIVIKNRTNTASLGFRYVVNFGLRF